MRKVRVRAIRIVFSAPVSVDRQAELVGVEIIIVDNTAMEFSTILAQACPGLRVETDPQILDSHGRDWSDLPFISPSAVVFPESVEQVRQLVLAAAENGIPLVPSGGRTGLSGGATCLDDEVVVSFDRMRKILDYSAVDRTVTVEPGVVTQAVQSFAAEKGLYYPVSFASEGSSQIGGNIATNAGGIRVVRYGLTRERVAGLKVVTGRGDVLDCNRGLVKNASGYDLRHLFVGSEGTLGFIVEATLRLIDPPRPSRVMLLGLESMEDVMSCFALFQSSLELSAFEFFDARSMYHVRDGEGLPAPLDDECPVYVITEFDCPDQDIEQRALECFEKGVEEGWLHDGVMSQSVQQGSELWRYREGIAEAAARHAPYKNDLSVVISRVPEFLSRLRAEFDHICPDYDVLIYGHIGDGNVHVNILRPKGESQADFDQRCKAITDSVSKLAGDMGGSASAEHGIGLLKAPWLATTRSGPEIDMMKGIKTLFDPAGILNPGKLFM
jgi:FAD/FMN-containing dehydrogenase